MIKEKSKKFKSIDDILRKNHKIREFKELYSEELMRLQIASSIKRLRTSKGLTQGFVAERTDMPQSVIARVESGSRGISLDTLGKIAYVLGKEVRLV